MIILLMGVSGSGKTTVGQLLAGALGWPFYDGDDFHPEENVAKMARGIPLTDADRGPWLDALRALIDDLADRGASAVVASSALKKAYRDRLMHGRDAVRLVYLKGDYALIRERMARRRGHFFQAGLLRSQFEALEEPDGGVAVAVDHPAEAVVQSIRQALGI